MLTMNSCSGGDEAGDSERTVTYPVEISVSEAGTRATADTRATGDYTGTNLSLSILYDASTSGLTGTDSRTNVRWDNIPHDASPLWTQVSEGTNPMQWRNTTDAAAILSYAPYQSITSTADLSALPFQVRQHQEYGLDSSDFVSYYNPAFVPGSTVQKIPITFNHQLCKLDIELVANDKDYIQGLDEVLTQQMLADLAQVKVSYVADKITYDAASFLTQTQGSDQFHPITTLADTTHLYAYVPDTANLAYQELILPPQTIRKDLPFIQVLVNDEVNCKHHIFKYVPLQEFKLEPGKEYTITLSLIAPTISEVTVTTKDWTKASHSTVDIGGKPKKGQ